MPIAVHISMQLFLTDLDIGQKSESKREWITFEILVEPTEIVANALTNRFFRHLELATELHGQNVFINERQ